MMSSKLDSTEKILETNAKTTEILKELEKTSPGMLKKIKDGVNHIKTGFIVTYKDAIYWSRLARIE